MTKGTEISYRVRGGAPLRGTVFVQGAKNAALKMIAAALLTDKGRTVLRNVPPIEDVRRATELAQAIGARVEFHEAERTLVVDASTLTSPVLPAEIARRFRGSVLFVPALLHRFGEAVIEGVGGCNLGSRNLDFHYRGFARLGATVDEGESVIRITAPDGLRGAHLYLDTPSHTGTENLMMAASLAPGTTVIDNTAQEPEVLDMIAFLSKMGAEISGGGTGFITVHGVSELTAVEHTVMADRIDAGVFAMAAAAAGGEINLVGANLDHLGVVRWKLEQMGVEFAANGAVLQVRREKPLRPINVITSPFPGFATDLQSPIMTLATMADGASYIRETIFDGRYTLVPELNKMGAKIEIDNNVAIVHGPTDLHGTEVVAHDLRGGAALILAGLAAEGETVISNGYLIDRGHAAIGRAAALARRRRLRRGARRRARHGLVSGPVTAAGAVPPVRERAREREEGVVRGGRADRDARPLAGERANGDPGRVARLGEGRGVLPQPEPDEVGLALRNGPAVGEQRLAYSLPFLHDGLHALEQLVLGAQRGHRRGLGDRVHGEGQHRLPHCLGHRLVADDEADAQAGQPVGLGEGAQHGHVGAVTVEVDAVGDAGIADVLAVGLVEDDQAVAGNPVEEIDELRLADHGAGRVVGVAHQDEPGARGDRRGHGRQVVRLIAQRHPDRRRAGQVRERRVRLERAPGVEDLVAGVADGLDELLEYPHRAAADRDVAGRHGEPLGERADERLGAVVRVAVDAARRLRDDPEHRRQRAVGRLVGGQLVRFLARGGDGRLARLVRGHGVKHRAEPG